MELLQIKRSEFNLGLKKEYRFFQISDMHISYCDSLSSAIDINEKERCEKQWNSMKIQFANDNNEFYDERYNIDSTVLLEALLNHAKNFKANAIILSGDIMDRVTESSMRYLKSLFEKSEIPIIYCLGNHDYMNENGDNVCQYERFKDFTQNPEYFSVDYDEFELLVIDNNKAISEKQLQFLKEKIASNKKLLLVEHKPLLLGEFGEKLLNKIGSYFFIGTEKDADTTKEYVNLVKENGNRFIAVLCGHIHSAKEYKITDNLMQITTSSGLIGAGREIIIKWGTNYEVNSIS